MKKLPYDEKITTQIQTEIPNIYEKFMNGGELSRKEEIEYQTCLNRAVYEARKSEIDTYEERITSNKETEPKPKRQIHPVTGQELPEGYELIKY